MSQSTSPTVHILMATYQGEAYIEQQLESIKQQTYRHWVLHVSDDGSSDQTLSHIQAFKSRLRDLDTNERVHLYKGPQKGSTENFMHLVRLLAKNERIDSMDLFAFADQDDVWLADKLEHAVAWHVRERSVDESEKRHPMLYAAKAYLVDETLRPLGQSKTPKGPLDFKSALVENVLSGNTMVMNKALIQILSGIEVTHSVWHDWSAYMVAACCGGRLFYDERPCVLYRQHEQNVIGVREGWPEQLSRARTVLKGRYKSWTQINLDGLKDIRSSLNAEALSAVELFESIRLERNVWIRLRSVKNLSIRRQSKLFQILFYVGLVLGFV